jgi:magnesium chelatase family protein
VAIQDLRGGGDGESSEIIRQRVEISHNIQYRRNGTGRLNNIFTTPEIEKFCQMDTETTVFFNKAIESLKLSARGYYRVLKVARTIADLDGGKDMLLKSHVAEALSFRPKTYLNT